MNSLDIAQNAIGGVFWLKCRYDIILSLQVFGGYNRLKMLFIDLFAAVYELVELLLDNSLNSLLVKHYGEEIGSLLD